jgi:hypothetical protein
MAGRIVGVHRDEERHSVAELECGHNRHARRKSLWIVARD